MALFVNFDGVSLYELGAYSKTTIAQTAPSEAQLGIVAIIGEADEGPSYAQETQGLAAVTFQPSQYQSIVNKYGEGELVDMARLAFNPSNDPDIQGGAQQLITMKTNQSVTASLTLAASYGVVSAYRAGAPGNLTNLTILQTTGITQTILSTTGNTHTSTAIDTLASTAMLVPGLSITGTGIPSSTTVVSVDYETESIVISNAATASAVGVALTFSRTITQDTITDNRPDLALTEVSSALGGTAVLAIWNTDSGASAATVTVTATTFSTTVTGGTSLNISVPLSQFTTVSGLIDYINSLPNYQAVLMTTTQGPQPPTVLDRVTVVSIHNTSAIINRDAADVQAFFASSQLVSFTPGTSGYIGLPAALAKTYFTGGALGPTTQANFQYCLDALAAANLNFIAPCFSQDATVDIAEGNTDPGSTYQIESINAAVLSHVNQQSTIIGRKERQAWCAFLDDSFINVENESALLAASRVSLVFQPVNALNAQGSTVLKQPHALSVIAAGMKAAAPVGLSNAFALIQISGFQTTNSQGQPYFDPETDATSAIIANLTYVQKADGGGFEFGIDNSTYAQQTNAWYYSRPSVIYASDIAAKTIRLNLQAFVGKRNSDVSNTTVSNLLVSVMDQLRAAGIIVPDTTSNGKGYTNISVTIAGNVVNVNVTIVLVEDLEFILTNISVQRAQF